MVCSNSFIQKHADLPWSVFVKKPNLEELSKKLVELDGIQVSGIGMGSLGEIGSWSKVDKFEAGRHIQVEIIDKDLFQSDIKDPELKENITRIDRIARNFPSDYREVEVSEVSQNVLNNISSRLEGLIEQKYSDSFGDTICKAKSVARRMWMPTNNDVLKFQISVNCLLPNDVVESIDDAVESVGERKTFKTIHRNGINSIVTPDESMYLRKIVFYDEDLGGPFFVFSVRDKKNLKEENFVEKIKVMENHLSKI